MSIFLKSFVVPYITPIRDCRGVYLVSAEVMWYKENGRLDHYGERVYFGYIHDDDYVDEMKLIRAMYGKTIYEANKIYLNWESDF